MNDSATPTFSMPMNAPKQDDARIGIAIVTFPHNCTCLWWNVLGNALQVGLERSGVKVIGHGSYFNKVIVVAMFTVPWELRGPASEAIKETARELGIMERATIATETADKGWHTVHDIGLIGVPFDEAFLKPEDIAAGRREYEASLAEASQTIQGFVQLIKSAQCERPENSGDKHLP